jgi:hypothetical protein
MQPIHIQRLIALPYLILGSWCLLAPHMVERLTITPAHQHLSGTTALLIGRVAQAVLGGLFIWFSRWERRTFLVYAPQKLLARCCPFSGSTIGSSMKCQSSTAGWHSISDQTPR